MGLILKRQLQKGLIFREKLSKKSILKGQLPIFLIFTAGIAHHITQHKQTYTYTHPLPHTYTTSIAQTRLTYLCKDTQALSLKMKSYN